MIIRKKTERGEMFSKVETMNGIPIVYAPKSTIARAMRECSVLDESLENLVGDGWEIENPTFETATIGDRVSLGKKGAITYACIVSNIIETASEKTKQLVLYYASPNQCRHTTHDKYVYSYGNVGYNTFKDDKAGFFENVKPLSPKEILDSLPESDKKVLLSVIPKSKLN